MNKKIYHRLRSAGVPRLYCQNIAAAYTDISNVIHETIGDKTICVVTGVGKCGKTYLACRYLVNDMPKRNPKRFNGEWEADDVPRYLSPLELNSTRLDNFTDYMCLPGLVLDDVYYIPPHSVRAVVNLIHYRSMSGLPTIITTRMTRDQFHALFGDRLIETIGLEGITVDAKQHFESFTADIRQGNANSSRQYEGLYAQREADHYAQQPKVENVA